MFNENSGLVRLWVSNIQKENTPFKKEDVPKLSNLQEVVYKLLSGE